MPCPLVMPGDLVGMGPPPQASGSIEGLYSPAEQWTWQEGLGAHICRDMAGHGYRLPLMGFSTAWPWMKLRDSGNLWGRIGGDW